ncbi:MAG: hypothetical protein AAFP90_05105 [Planctomycetota bacterium]
MLKSNTMHHPLVMLIAIAVGLLSARAMKASDPNNTGFSTMDVPLPAFPREYQQFRRSGRLFPNNNQRPQPARPSAQVAMMDKDASDDQDSDDLKNDADSRKDEKEDESEKQKKGKKKKKEPTPEELALQFDAAVKPPVVSAMPGDFNPTPIPAISLSHDHAGEQFPYDYKTNPHTQRPWFEWPRPFYGSGIIPRSGTVFGTTNLSNPQFYAYGDLRTAVSTGRNGGERIDNWSTRLNLDLDLRLTASERFHAFLGPLNQGGNGTGLQINNGQIEGRDNTNLNVVTGFFEGDLGAMMGGLRNASSPSEIPITLGLVPLLYQNGTWMEDAVVGGAIALPAKHSRLLDWSNFDATAFAILDSLNSPVFGDDDHAGQAFGTAWFIEAYGGYIEAGYAYVRDRQGQGRSYSNTTISFTRRYFDRISNGVRLIHNSGQDLPSASRTADGTLIIFENSLVTGTPLTTVPYFNFFAGFGSPQSVARAGVSGGVLRNVGILFEPDGLNGFPTLDAGGNNTFGGAVGIDLIGGALDRQLVLELAYLDVMGSQSFRAAKGRQLGAGARYQFPISNAVLLRFDVMYGNLDDDNDVYGARSELRWKF